MRARTCVTIAIFGVMVSACDDATPAGTTSGAPPTKQETPPSAAALAAPPPVSAAATATAAAEAPKRKERAPCSKDANVTFSDMTLEAAVRRQLQKDNGPVPKAELAKVKTLDLSQAASNDDL